MKPCLHSVLKPVGDYPDCKYMGDWDALCTIQQRAFHGQSADPLAGVQLRQCNPKLFNQITRAWEKFCLWIMYVRGVGGGYVAGYEFQCQCDYAPLKPETFCSGRWSVNDFKMQVKDGRAHKYKFSFLSTCVDDKLKCRSSKQLDILH